MRASFSAEDGAAMLEALLVLPVILILAAGIFEFGAVLYYKLEMETGLRDAARYLARCKDITAPLGSPVFGCSEAQARSIAAYGASGSTPRVPGWAPGDVTISYRTIANPIVGGEATYNSTSDVLIVVASSDINYAGGNLLALVGIPFVQMAARHEERYIGW